MLVSRRAILIDRDTLPTKQMRTVLATDEMLAHEVSKQLPGEVEVFGRARMRDEGMGAVRAAVERAPCVLVIGAREWPPGPTLDEWALDGVPVVAILPDGEAAPACAKVSVPAHQRQTVRAVTAACRLAWLAQGTFLPPVIVAPTRPREPQRPRPASVLAIRR